MIEPNPYFRGMNLFLVWLAGTIGAALWLRAIRVNREYVYVSVAEVLGAFLFIWATLYTIYVS